jgi:hypothetical protein
MKTLTFAGLLTSGLVAAGCGSSSKPHTISGHGGNTERPAAVLYFGYGEGTLFQADCWAPGGEDCTAIEANAQAGGSITDGRLQIRLGATRTDLCEASGDQADVVSYEVLDGPEDVAPGIVRFPNDAAIDLIEYESGEVKPDAALLAVLVALANANQSTDGPTQIYTAKDIVVTQDIVGNFVGDRALDRVVAANIPTTTDSPEYNWSVLAIAPGGNLSAMTVVWTDLLEVMALRASYDLDGDGVRSVLWDSSYYEGGAGGAASLANGTFGVISSWSCGA